MNKVASIFQCIAVTVAFIAYHLIPTSGGGAHPHTHTYCHLTFMGVWLLQNKRTHFQFIFSSYSCDRV